MVNPENPVIRPPFCFILNALCSEKMWSSLFRCILSNKKFPKYSLSEMLQGRMTRNGRSSVARKTKNGLSHFGENGGLVMIIVFLFIICGHILQKSSLTCRIVTPIFFQEFCTSPLNQQGSQGSTVSVFNCGWITPFLSKE